MKNYCSLISNIAVCIVCAVCVVGCERYEERVEQVVWQNNTSHNLSVKVYTTNGEWNFDLMQGSEKMICNQKYKSLDPDIDTFNPSHYPPFDAHWACDFGMIDSVVFENKDTGERLKTCSDFLDSASYSYKPLSQMNCYQIVCSDVKTIYTFDITNKRYQLLSDECPCSAEDISISVDSLEGTIHFYDFYAVWYFKTTNRPQKFYMLEHLPSAYCQENLQVILSGTGHAVQLIEPYRNFFTGGCLSNYIIEK